MNTKREQNIYSRLLRGVVGVNDFFVNRETYLCSYVNSTSYLTFFHLSLRKQIVLLILYMIDQVIYIKNNIPLSIQKTSLYSDFILLSKSCWSLLENKLV